MNALQKSIAAIGLGAALAFSVPATAVAGGPPHARSVYHYGHPGKHYGHGPRWRHNHRHWKRHHHRHHRRHDHRVVHRETVYYEQAPAADPSIIISPNIQLGGGGSYDGGATSSTLGTVVGAVAGAAVGSQIGKGRGNTAAIAIGSVVGGHLGGRMATGY